MTTPPSTTRGIAGLLAGLLAGAVSAVCFAYGLRAFAEGGDSLSVLGAYVALGVFVFSSAPLFMAGLGAGAQSVIAGAVAGFAGLALKVDFDSALYFATLCALPAVILSCLAIWGKKNDASAETIWYPEGYLLTVAALFPLALLVVRAILVRDVEGGLLAQTAGAMRMALQQAVKAGGPEAALVMPPENIEAIVQYLAPLMPALAGLIWVSATGVAALFAQISLQRSHYALRPALRLVPMIVPQSLLPGVALSGLVAFFGGGLWAYLGANICIMLCMPYFFVGLAVVHALARKMQRGGVAFLIVFYLILSGITGLAILVALLGTLDQGLQLQKKLLAPSTKNGSP